MLSGNSCICQLQRKGPNNRLWHFLSFTSQFCVSMFGFTVNGRGEKQQNTGDNLWGNSDVNRSNILSDPETHEARKFKLI